MKENEKDSPDSWIFEKDIHKVIRDNCNRKKNKIWKVTGFVFLSLHFIGYFCLSDYYGNARKAGEIILISEIVTAMAAALTTWVLIKRIVKRYWTIILVPILALIAVIVVMLLYTNGNVSLQASDILPFCGNYLAFLGTFCLGYFIYFQDRIKMIEEKRTKVKLLITLMENADMELLNLG